MFAAAGGGGFVRVGLARFEIAAAMCIVLPHSTTIMLAMATVMKSAPHISLY